MKNTILKTLVLLTLTAFAFSSVIFLQPIEDMSSSGQWNHNPEETNDTKLYIYMTMLDEGIITEQMVFEEIAYCNNLTDQGVKDLINAGYLHSYIDALIAAGRLPEGFTPTAPAPENPPTDEPEDEDNDVDEDVYDEPEDDAEDQDDSDEEDSNNTDEITCDDTVFGTYIVIKAETKSYSSYNTSSSRVKTWALGEEASVTGLTSNGYYKVANEDKEQYIKKDNLVLKGVYDAAWTESNKVESTCTEEGSVSYINSYTNETKTEILLKSDHKFDIIDKTEATCETDGYEVLKCSMCEVETEKTIPKTGHLEGIVCGNCKQVVMFGKAFSPAVVGGIATIIVLSVGVGSFFVFKKI